MAGSGRTRNHKHITTFIWDVSENAYTYFQNTLFQRKASQTESVIISRLSYSLFNANYSTRELFLRARRGIIYRGAHLAYLHRTKEKKNKQKEKEPKVQSQTEAFK